MSIDVLDGLERVGMPSYLADREGRIRWLNEEALSALGDARGRLLSSLAAPDHAQRSREQLAKKVVGGAVRKGERQRRSGPERRCGARGGNGKVGNSDRSRQTEACNHVSDPIAPVAVFAVYFPVAAGARRVH